MNFKKLLALLLSLSLLLNFTACGNGDDSAPTTTEKATNALSETVTIDGINIGINIPIPNSSSDSNNDDTDFEVTPLLYKVTDTDGNVVWLFGSIHVGAEYFYPLPDYVMDAYNSSDALAVEFDITVDDDYEDVFIDYLYDMAYMDGSKLQEHIPEDLYNSAKEILKDNDYYFSEMDYYKPGLWSELIDEIAMEHLDLNTELGIDYFFLNTAHDENKTIYDIESMEFQLGMTAQYSEALQILLLEASVESYYETDEYQEEIDEMLEIWARGDAEGISDDPDEYEFESEEEEELYIEYNTIMITDRNYNMTNFAENALTSGEEVFIVVGAAHVVGDDGIANQLKERGYTVEVIQG